MATLACKIKRGQAAAFKSYCANRGQTSNTALKDYVLGCIGERESPQESAEGTTEYAKAGAVSLPPGTLKTAQKAAQAAGEAVPVFVARAVEAQAQRDERGRMMEGGKPNE